ncbi:MAG: putative baseplate assembly protein [Acidobacteriota bacterium]
MMNLSEICQDQTDRRQRIRDVAQRAESNEPNGIDYVEVDENQRIITVYFLNKAPLNIQPQNVRITGGVRVRNIQVDDIRLCRMDEPDRDDCMRVFVDKFGDFSPYTLKLVNAPGGFPGESPLTGFDPRYAQIDFSFKANCPSDLDCLPVNECYRAPLPEPEISYLAKDYNSFRQLIFDRLALTMPNWTERHVPELGVAVVELLAYVGDYLSYYQDAVASEAYLDTARERISVRRHALLVDYRMHEGCNARSWVCVTTDKDVALEHPEDIYFITGTDTSYSVNAMLQHADLRAVPREQYEAFEPLLPRLPGDTILIYQAHNSIEFYTWRDQECCLPRGATSATLKDKWKDPDHSSQPAKYDDRYSGYSSTPKKQVRRGADYEAERYDEERQQQRGPKKKPRYETPKPERERALKLKPGDVLIFEEVLGPKTGVGADADRSHRHAVCLTRVEEELDELYDQPIVHIEWSPEDALPFTFCLSSIGPAPQCLPLMHVSVARGNAILVDHGWRQVPETFAVPGATEISAGCATAFEPREMILQGQNVPASLKYGPVTYRVPYPLPADIARTQVQFLSGFLRKGRLHFEQVWKQLVDGEPLSAKQLAELEVVFGRPLLVRLGLIGAGTKEKHEVDPKRQAEVLAKLLGRFDEFLTKKAKRLQVLRNRVLGGYVLTLDEENEIREMFGEDLAGDLGFLTRQILGAASGVLRQQPRDALPCIDVFQSDIDPLAHELRGASNPEEKPHPHWTPKHNLLESDGLERHFVSEVDNDGRAHLRFGNGELGRAPEPGSSLEAIYRVGNGSRGNVGAESISYIVFRRAGSIGANLSVRNPLPAQGGVEPEPLAEVKMFAPGGFRKELRRAITADDYARLAELAAVNKVQRAAGNLRWAGSWYEMRTAIDPLGVEETEPELRDDLLSSLYRFRRIGHDVTIENARYVPLNIALQVCVLPSYLRGHVKAALIDVFSNLVLPNGQRGFFHPDNLSFGQGIYLSSLVAAAQAVEGVDSVRVTRLQRLFEGEKGELEKGLLPLGPLEVARNDNDPNFPEHGLFVLEVGGGR